jgi:hypothetical protein
MMTILEKAEGLRQEAILLLLDERKRIDESLAQLGYEKAPLKKRGRPPKSEAQVEDPQPLVFHSGTSE